MAPGNDTYRRLAATAVCFYAMMTISFAPNTSTVCLTAIADELGFSDSLSGFFLSCAFWGVVVGVVTSGLLADRWGFRMLLMCSGICHGVGVMMSSYATVGLHAFGGALLAGIGDGIILTLTTPIVCHVYPRSRTKACCILHAAPSLGALTAIALILLSRHLGLTWRGIYRLMFVLALLPVPAYLFLPTPELAQDGSRRIQIKTLLSMRSFMALPCALVLVGAAEVTVPAWLPAYLEKVAGSARSSAALGAMLLAGLGTLGRFLNLVLFHRIGIRSVLVAGGLIGTGALLLTAVPVNIYFTMFCFAAFVLVTTGFGPAIIARASEHFPQAGASMYSLLMVAGNLGCVAGPFAVGLAAEAWGLRTGMAALAVLPFALTLIVLNLMSGRPHGLHEPVATEPLSGDS